MKYLALAAVLAVGMSGIAVGQTISADGTSVTNDSATAQSRLATRAQRLQVRPLNWDETRGTGLRTEAPEVIVPGVLPGQASGSTAGGRPSLNADIEAQRTFSQDWQGMRSGATVENLDGATNLGNPGALGTQDIFSQYCENCGALHMQWPMRAVGKLFSNSGSCSASVVSPNNIIVTAAHCCYNRSNSSWVYGWEFAPAYRDGFAPYGMFNWRRAQIVPRWISHGDRQSDVCVIQLANNSANRPVTFYTGWLGRSWNWPTTQVHHSIGYPGNIGGGNKQELCVSESFNPSSGCGGTSVLNTGCSMTYGA
ncbi:MAG: trypsin-like serine protease, partial [Pseudomonadota bacterium]